MKLYKLDLDFIGRSRHSTTILNGVVRRNDFDLLISNLGSRSFKI